jgi:integrase
MKVTVAVEAFKGRLRLRWSYQKRRYCMTLGLDDTARGRVLAQNRVLQIEKDIELDNFDPTLERYQRSVKPPKASGISAVALFEQFTAHKRKGDITDRTAVKYKSLVRKIAAFFGGQSAVIDDDHADRFREALAETLAPDTQRAYLFFMQAAWAWGMKRKLVAVNPWGDVLARVKVIPKQPPEAFSKEEIALIVEGFRGSQYYSHYTDLVTFLFGAGCRTGEAIGLQWKHLSEDCGSVWIYAAKTNRARTFKLSSHLQTMLMSRRPVGFGPDDLVFPAVQGGEIDGHNFRNRAWVTVLKNAGVAYRTPYTTRHSFISHSLRVQRDEDVARMAGHKVETMRKHYAADVSGGLQCPDIFA